MPLWSRVATSIVGRLDREEIEDRRGADEMRRAAAVRGHVRHAVARRDRRLVGVGGQRDVGHHPVRADVVARRSRDMSSSLAGRSSGGRPWRRRLARSLSRPCRPMPMIGAKSKLLAKVPFSMTSVAGARARKPRRHSCEREGQRCTSRPARAAGRTGRCGSRTSCRPRRAARRRDRASGTRRRGRPGGHERRGSARRSCCEVVAAVGDQRGVPWGTAARRASTLVIDRAAAASRTSDICSRNPRWNFSASSEVW